MTKAQQIHEAVTRLVEQGSDQADAFRQVAEQTGLKYDSVRGAYYTARRVAEGGTPTTRRSRKRETTPEDAVAAAIATLERSIEDIEQELEVASARALEAQAELEDMRASSGPKIEAIRAKITLLATEPEATTAAKPAKTASARKEASK